MQVAPKIHYFHSKYAGNKGDLWKHGVLDLMAQQWIQGKSQSFSFMDSHCGSGIYQLRPGGQWKRGLGELADHQDLDFLDFALKHFQQTKTYYGSFALLLQRHTIHHLTLCDHSSDVHDDLRRVLPELPKPEVLQTIQEDSFALLRKIPIEADITLIDPAYSLKDGKGNDWEKLPSICQRWQHREKWLAVWYPIYGSRDPHQLIKLSKMRGLEVYWDLKRQSPFVPRGCGVLVNESAWQAIHKRYEKLEALAKNLRCELHSNIVLNN